MKNYLEKRREELRKRDGGFTLMEMLIVVAIIAVLIAIAIPVFTSQLERSREATDLANLRSAYAEQMAALVSWDGENDSIEDVTVTPHQTIEKWQSDNDADNTVIADGITNGSGKSSGVTVPCSTVDGSDWTVHVNTDKMVIEITVD